MCVLICIANTCQKFEVHFFGSSVLGWPQLQLSICVVRCISIQYDFFFIPKGQQSKNVPIQIADRAAQNVLEQIERSSGHIVCASRWYKWYWTAANFGLVHRCVDDPAGAAQNVYCPSIQIGCIRIARQPCEYTQ